MADTVIAASLTLDDSKATKNVKTFKKELRDAEKELESVQQEFGETSEEAKKASARIDELKESLSEAGKAGKSIKQELKEANEALIKAQREFGATSEEALKAARRVAELRDAMQEAREVTELFDPGARFQAFGNVLRTVAGGFSALTGTMALFGAESEDVEKALLKVQAALAVTEGVNTIVDAAKDFDRLKAVALETFDSLKGAAMKAFSSIKAGIASTGIGLLVVAVGTIVAYWDDISEAVTGVSAEQKKALSDAQALVAADKERLEHLGSQDNVLKLQGKSERYILELKIKETEQAMKNLEVLMEIQKRTTEDEAKAVEKNKQRFGGVIDFVFSKLGGSAATSNLIFNAEKTRAEGEQTLKETQKIFDKMKNDQAGFLLSLQQLDKDAAQKGDEKRKAEQDAERDHQKKLQGIRNDAANAGIKDAFTLADRRLKQQYEADQAEIRQAKLTAKQKYEELEAIRVKYEADRKVLIDTNIADLDAKIRAADEADAQREKDKQAANYALVVGGGQAVSERLTQILKDNAEAQGKIESEKLDNKRKATEVEIELLYGVSNILGQQTAAGKALAVAATLISTYQSATDSYRAMAKIPVVGPALGAAAAAVAIVNGLANVKRIVAVQVPGAPGGSIPSIPSSAPAPLTPSRPEVVNTKLDSEQLNQIGNATVRAFVLESDIANNQERVNRLNRAARLGG